MGQAILLAFSLNDLFTISGLNALILVIACAIGLLVLHWFYSSRIRRIRHACGFIEKNLSDGYLYIDAQLRGVRASQRLNDLFADAPTNIDGLTLEEIFGDTLASQIREAVKSGKHSLFGIAGNIVLNIKIVKPENGFLSNGHLLVFTDATKIIQLESRLVSQVELFKKLTETMSEGYVLHAETGAILECNKKACEILGITEGQLLGRDSLDPRWRSITVEGQPYPGTMHPAMRTLGTKKSLTGEIMGVEIPEKGTRWIEINTRYVSEPDLGSSRVMVTFADVTHRFTEKSKV